MLPAHPSDFPRFSEEAQANFFAETLARAMAAEDEAGQIQHDYLVAGVRIRLSFAGPALAQLLLPALAHRLVPLAGEADVVLHLWDSVSTGISMPPPPFGRHCFCERGDIRGFESIRFRSAFDPSDCALHLFDADSDTGLFWVQDAALLPYWTRAAPLRALFHWLFAARGGQLVHGAAVGTADGALLIAGKGGIGKSTTALACLDAGFDVAGDDYVLLTGGDSPAVHSLYRTIKVNEDTASRFPTLKANISDGRPTAGGGKGVILLDDSPRCAGRLVLAMPLRAVLAARFGNEVSSRVEAIDRNLLTGAATYSCLAQLPGAGRDAVEMIAGIMERLPGGRLVLGTDLTVLPAALATYLADPDAIPSPPPAADLPFVSIVIPVRNGAHFIGAALASVLAQNLPKLEIIVVDDGSEDRLELALATLPVQVRSLRIEAGAPSAARNAGAGATTADYLAFLDVDDVWPDGALRAMLLHLEAHPGVGVAIGRSQVVAGPGNAGCGGDFIGSPDDSFPYHIGAALFRRSALDIVGLFDPALRFGEDLDWFARAREAGLVIARLDLVTLHKGRHHANMTGGRTALDLVPLQLARSALQRKRAIAPGKTRS